MSESAIRIAALLPDVLGTYSDRGNVTVLSQRARWRGLQVEDTVVLAGSTPPVDCDLYLLGGGEDAAQQYAAEWFRDHRQLGATLAERATTLAICAGLQVLGEWMQDSSGTRTAGAGILPLTTTAGTKRAVGEVVSECGMPGVGLLTGFENHMGRTTLAAGVAPLGRTLSGVGNGGGDGGVDGVLTSTVVGTYMHGPVLARNPALADALLQTVTGEPLPPLDLPDQEAVRRIRLGDGAAARPRRGRLGAARRS
jgi:CobQ-like glutamine amidotransferase family enzyme